jgi:hypothetical protein
MLTLAEGNSFVIMDSTKISGHGKTGAMTDLRAGDAVFVYYTKRGEDLEATKITVRTDAKAAKKRHR